MRQLSSSQSLSKLPRLKFQSPSELRLMFGTLWLPSSSCQSAMCGTPSIFTKDGTGRPLYFIPSRFCSLTHRTDLFNFFAKNCARLLKIIQQTTGRFFRQEYDVMKPYLPSGRRSRTLNQYLSLFYKKIEHL